MLLIGIATTVIAVTLIVLTCCMIPVLREVRRSAIALHSLSVTLDAEVKPLIGELRETIAHVQEVTKVTAANADNLDLLLEQLGNTGHSLNMVNHMVQGAGSLLSRSSYWMTGARVAGRFLVDKLWTKKRG